MSEPLADRPLPGPPEAPPISEEEDRFLDGIDRATWRVGRTIMVGIPTLFVLLFAVPLVIPGIAPLPALVVALVATTVVCALIERRIARDRVRTGVPRPSGLAIGVGGGAVFLFLVYLVVVVTLGGR